jgi:hypothetical protein
MFMKTKYLYLVALALLVCFTSCKNEEPFDTQDPNDAPQILIPYETESGHLSYVCSTPDTPLYDSVVVTPSRYTTVNWYLDGQLVFTGTKINMCFPVGTYALVIEAVTDAGKRTERTGGLSVMPYDTDPYAAAPVGGRHVVPGMETTISGKNLSKVARIIITKDLYGEDELCSVVPSAKSDGQLTFTLPAIEDGSYYLRFVDEEGKVYGSDAISILNGVIALSGYDVFSPLKEWVITGVNMENVVAVTVGTVEVTELVATNTTVTLTAPDVEVGEYTLTMRNSDGSFVKFGTDVDAPTQTIVRASLEVTLWTGPVALKWDDKRVRLSTAEMAEVSVGKTICIYWEKLPDGDPNYYDEKEGKVNVYYNMEIITAWWTDIIPKITSFDESTPNPITFTYDEAAQALVQQQEAMAVVGWGLNINKITYK